MIHNEHPRLHLFMNSFCNKEMVCDAMTKDHVFLSVMPTTTFGEWNDYSFLKILAVKKFSNHFHEFTELGGLGDDMFLQRRVVAFLLLVGLKYQGFHLWD